MAINGFGTTLQPFIGDLRQPALIPGLLWNPDRSAVEPFTNSLGSGEQLTLLTFTALTAGQNAEVTLRLRDTSDAVAVIKIIGPKSADDASKEALKQVRSRFGFSAVVKAATGAPGVLNLVSKTAFSVANLVNVTSANSTNITTPDVIPFAVPVFSSAPSANNPRGVEPVNRALVATDQVRGITIRRSLGVLKRNANGDWVDGYDENDPVPVASRAKISVACAEDSGMTPEVYYFFSGPNKGFFSGTAGANKTLLPTTMFRWAEFVPANSIGWLNIN